MTKEWTIAGFGHADGDENELKRVVLAAFETFEEALAAYKNGAVLDALSERYEDAGGDVFFFEWALQHGGADVRIDQ